MARNQRFSPGQVVCATAGHDQGRCYLVLGYASDGRVLLADGRYRNIEHPKTKKQKHVQALPAYAQEIAQKLYDNRSVTDVELRTALTTLGYKTGNGYKEDSLA